MPPQIMEPPPYLCRGRGDDCAPCRVLVFTPFMVLRYTAVFAGAVRSLSFTPLTMIMFMFMLHVGDVQSASALDWCTEEVKAHILKVDFEWDEFGDGFRWDDVIAGITLYKTLYGEMPDDEFKVRSMWR